MDNKYLIVSTSVLPEYFEQVVKTREMIESGEINISQACQKNNISRSTYYKYKDNVFRPDREYGKKSICRQKYLCGLRSMYKGVSEGGN